MTLSIRTMQNSDLDSVYAIEAAAHKAPWSRDILWDCIYIAYDCRVLELVEGAEVKLIGYIISRFHDKICHILNICIDPTQQAKGYGQFLLQNLLDEIINTDTQSVILEVRPSNAPALHIYNKSGFQQIGIKSSYYQDPDGSIEDAVVLQKVVKPRS